MQGDLSLGHGCTPWLRPFQKFKVRRGGRIWLSQQFATAIGNHARSPNFRNIRNKFFLIPSNFE